MNHQDKLAALIILDGFAMRDEEAGNAIKQANMPNFDRYWAAYPHSQLTASGEAVGLPEGQMGNSEVGHLNIGAGRIVYQSLTRVNLAIREGDFYQIRAFLESIHKAKTNNKALHLFGLLSDGGVHSHISHLFALLELAKENELEKVYVHGFLDGRDVGPQTALTYIKQTEAKMKELGVGEFATISGRYYSMDRDRRWERVKKSYEAMAQGKGPRFKHAEDVIQTSYEEGIHDEFILPSVLVDDADEPIGLIEDNDSIIFYNFRPDRALQISQTFVDADFRDFDRGENVPSDIDFVTFTSYSESLNGFVAFAPNNLDNTIGDVLSRNGLKQLRIAETEKYPHVTYFMSGGRNEEFPGETRILIESPKVATYDLQPEMSAYEITDTLIEELEAGNHQAIILNFANPDMVGHSGKLGPTVEALEAVDECLGRVVDKIVSLGGTAIITADHGNSDEVVTMEGQPMTAHTTNPVPVIVTNKDYMLRDGGILADLSPTLLDILDLEKPMQMTGESLLIK